MSARATGSMIDRYTTPAECAALREALVVVTTMAFNELASGGANSLDWRADRQGVFGISMPAQYIARYDQQVCREFLVCLTVAASKLTEPVWRPFACVGEEMAAYTFIEAARAQLQERGHPNAEQAYMLLIEEAFEDIDFRFLFEPAADGIQDTPRGKAMGIVHLDFDDWFTPFRPETPVHPFVAGLDNEEEQRS